MRLIRRIKIRYFRSIYSTSVKKCQDLNVLSGCNDVGKSNILKALNLFFNKQTDWDTAFDFQTDFSHQRLEQVRKESVKGKQFVSIEIEFERPKNYQGSLPAVLTVSRTWLRDSSGSYQEANNLERQYAQGNLPSSLETARRFLSQFLNRIHFEYVPAVKDRLYFEHLLSRLQARLLESPLDEPTQPLVENLAGSIENQIGELKGDFFRATGIETLIQPPAQLSSLFQAFLVSTEVGNQSIPLTMHGDGIQARWVPSVLFYITLRSRDFFIWGFEEPENSLEYSHVQRLADDFESNYAHRAQILLSSHSPAFVSLRGDSTSCYRVHLENEATAVDNVFPAPRRPELLDRLSRDIGLLRIQEEIHEAYSQKLAGLEASQQRVVELEAVVQEAQKPLLLVEGPTDACILAIAWNKLHPDNEMPFVVREADPAAGDPEGGAGGAASVALMVEALHPADNRRAVGLLDYDQEGLRAFNSLSRNFHVARHDDRIKIHRNGLSAAVLVHTPTFRGEYDAAGNLPIEYLFPDEALAATSPDGRALRLSDPDNVQIRVEGREVTVTSQLRDAVFATMPLPGYSRIIGGKRNFAREIVPALDRDYFIEFNILFDRLVPVLQGHPSADV